MTETLFQILRVAAALGCGMMAGVYFAFSTSVMGGLGRIAPAQGIAAMQSINRVIINPLFLTVFLGTAGLCALVAFFSLGWTRANAALPIIGGAVYLVGSIFVTALFNVPMNTALDVLDPNTPESANHWADYLRGWTAWNHVRAVALLTAATLLTIA
jgi:uncharacterized membrane protein